MQVRFEARAIADLDSITAWYDGIAPDITRSIIDDIERTILRLREFPRSGPAIGLQDLRRAVTRRYRFKVAYRIEPQDIVIIGIFRHQNRIA